MSRQLARRLRLVHRPASASQSQSNMEREASAAVPAEVTQKHCGRTVHVGRLAMASFFIAVAGFLAGFFLMRAELPTIAANVACSENAGETLEPCTLPPRFQRLVFIVVDALRYDFIKPWCPSSASPRKESTNTSFSGQVRQRWRYPVQPAGRPQDSLCAVADATDWATALAQPKQG